MIKSYLVRSLTKTIDSTLVYKAESLDKAIDDSLAHTLLVYKEAPEIIHIKKISGG